MSRTLKLLPLGGLGEIGMNMMLLSYGNEAILIDCGVMFPDQATPGMDLIIPNLTPVADPDLRLLGIILTHGHEDHLGALPFVLRRKPAPVFGSRFTLEVVRRKMEEFNLRERPTLTEIFDAKPFTLGPFSIEPIPVSHSISDAMGLAIRTPLGLVLHTGDFKLDPDPADGRKTDLDRFAELGKEGVLLLLSDSTNVEVEGESHSECSVKSGITDIVKETPGWFVMSSFASHIPRIQIALEIAQEHSRKVLPLGRTMVSNIEIARRIGYLPFTDHLFIEEGRLGDHPRDEIMILCTGSQGEQRSALSRMALGALRDVQLKKGDHVVLSSRFIPGNEKAINAVINDIFRTGAEVILNRGSDVHVSGHAYQEDLRKVLAVVKPKYFVPIHGEYRHLVRHHRLAIETGVPAQNAFLLEDGHPLAIKAEGAKRLPPIPVERSVILDSEVTQIGAQLVSDRKKMGHTGVVSATLVTDVETGDLLHDVHIQSMGVHVDSVLPKIHQDLARLIEVYYLNTLKERKSERADLVEGVAAVVRKYMKKRFDKKPLVLPAILRL